MIQLPTFAQHMQTQLYHDSANPNLLYVDLLQPAPVTGSHVLRWMPLPEQLAYLVGEIRFGSSSAELADLPASYARMQAMPMPWEPGPVAIWSHADTGVRALATGKTAGFGISNAIFNATAPARAMIEPICIAAVLTCNASVAQAVVHAAAVAKNPHTALIEALASQATTWKDTVGAVLIRALEQLVHAGVLVLQIAPDQLAVQTELHQLVLLEWAQRIATQHQPQITSLAAPALAVGQWNPAPQLDYTIDWRDSVSMRTIRTLSDVISDK